MAVEYAGVTFVETRVRAGRGPAAQHRPMLPHVPGNGVGGRVVAVGSGIDPGLVGSAVVATTGGSGGYAELALARVEDTIPLPPGVVLQDAVALLADGRTAVLQHRRAELKPNERVLVTAAGGGVGTLLVQLAAASGATVVGAARGTRKRELVTSLGAAVYVDYSRPGWERELLPEGVDVVFDGVGGALGAQAMRAARRGTRAVLYGMASGAWTNPPEHVRVVPSSGVPSPAEIRAAAEEALALAAAGRLRPVIGQTFPLSEAARAHEVIEARATIGKTLLIP